MRRVDTNASSRISSHGVTNCRMKTERPDAPPSTAHATACVMANATIRPQMATTAARGCRMFISSPLYTSRGVTLKPALLRWTSLRRCEIGVHGGGSLVGGDQWKCIEHMLKVPRAQTVQMRDTRLDLGDRRWRLGRDYPIGQGDNPAKGQGIGSRLRHRQPLDDRYRHVRPDTHANEVVRDKTVQDAAKEYVKIAADSALHAKQCVGGYHSAGDYGSDQGEAIGRGRHIAIREPRSGERVCVQQPRGDRLADVFGGSVHVRDKGLDLFSFEHRERPGVRPTAEVFTVVGRIQLAAEAHTPSVA